MLLDLKAVLEWNPEMADAYDLLALARNAGGTTTAAMQAERTAITLSPRNEHYTLHLAQIYIASKMGSRRCPNFAPESCSDMIRKIVAR